MGVLGMPAPGFGKRITIQEDKQLLAKSPLPQWLDRNSPVYTNVELCERI